MQHLLFNEIAYHGQSNHPELFYAQLNLMY